MRRFLLHVACFTIMTILGLGIIWLAVSPDDDHPTNYLDPVLHP